MRNTFPSRDELSAMSLSRLRNLDIQEADEEALVQDIVTTKLASAPLDHPVYRGDVPDIKTPEDEKKWQEVIDLRTQAEKEKLGRVVEKTKEETVEVTEPEVTDEELGIPFSCEICNGKRGHKKACPNK